MIYFNYEQDQMYHLSKASKAYNDLLKGNCMQCGSVLNTIIDIVNSAYKLDLWHRYQLENICAGQLYLSFANNGYFNGQATLNLIY